MLTAFQTQAKDDFPNKVSSSLKEAGYRVEEKRYALEAYRPGLEWKVAGIGSVLGGCRLTRLSGGGGTWVPEETIRAFQLMDRLHILRIPGAPAPIYWSDGLSANSGMDLQFRGLNHIPHHDEILGMEGQSSSSETNANK